MLSKWFQGQLTVSHSSLTNDAHAMPSSIPRLAISCDMEVNLETKVRHVLLTGFTAHNRQDNVDRRALRAVNSKSSVSSCSIMPRDRASDMALGNMWFTCRTSDSQARGSLEDV